MSDRGACTQLSDLHVTVTVTRDDATGIPTIYLRDTVDVAGNELERYLERIQAWLLARPLPDETLAPYGFPLRVDEGWRPERLDVILDGMDGWAPPPASHEVYDHQRDAA